MDTKYTKPPDHSTSHDAPSFAEQAAHDALGKHWVHPADHDFQDHGLRWQQLGDVAGGIVGDLERRHGPRARERRNRPRRRTRVAA